MLLFPSEEDARCEFECEAEVEEPAEAEKGAARMARRCCSSSCCCCTSKAGCLCGACGSVFCGRGKGQRVG